MKTKFWKIKEDVESEDLKLRPFAISDFVALLSRLILQYDAILMGHPRQSDMHYPRRKERGEQYTVQCSL